MTLGVPEAGKQAGLATLAALGLLFPQALPIILGLLLLITVTEAWAGKALTRLGAWRNVRTGALVFLLPLLALMLSPWAEWPGPAAGRAARLALELAEAVALGAILLAFPRETAVQRGKAACWGLAAGALLAVIDLSTGGGLTGWLRGQPVDAVTYGRSAVLAALVVIPLLLAARVPLWQRIGLILPGILLALLSANLAAKLILPVAALAALIGLWRFGPGLLAGLISLAVLLPGVLPMRLTPADNCALWAGKPSAAHRLLIWTYADGLIDQRPWTGWGLDAARRLGAVAPEAAVPDCARAALGRDTVPLLPLHPHNGALQLWLELGLAGAVFLPLLMIGLIRPLFQRSPLERATATSAFAGASVPLLVSFGLWQGWWLAGLALLWGLVILLMTPRS
ncbi:MAG: O-antigen ligase family protein [Elstera sp.]